MHQQAILELHLGWFGLKEGSPIRANSKKSEVRTQVQQASQDSPHKDSKWTGKYQTKAVFSPYFSGCLGLST